MDFRVYFLMICTVQNLWLFMAPVGPKMGPFGTPMGAKTVKNEVRKGLEIHTVSKVGPKGAQGRPRAHFLVDLGGILVRFGMDFCRCF